MLQWYVHTQTRLEEFVRAASTVTVSGTQIRFGDAGVLRHSRAFILKSIKQRFVTMTGAHIRVHLGPCNFNDVRDSMCLKLLFWGSEDGRKGSSLRNDWTVGMIVMPMKEVGPENLYMKNTAMWSWIDITSTTPVPNTTLDAFWTVLFYAPIDKYTTFIKIITTTKGDLIEITWDTL